MLFYKICCIFRILLVLWPQTGYIHPDEHFQGPEIVYGDIAKFQVFRTWEFTSSNPIRSIVFPYVVSVLPATIIQAIRYVQCSVGPYLLLVLPRLVMCAFSFIIDICIYKTCTTLNFNGRKCLSFFSSSFVALVFLIRTFSNSLECIYFALLICILSQIYKYNNEFMGAKVYNFVYEKYLFYNFIFGVILCMGVFNRPTFVCFAIFPSTVLAFLTLRLDTRLKLFITIGFSLGFFSTSVLIIFIDTFYYNKSNYSSVHEHQIIITPLNFLLYNLNSENLHNHGIHPRWLHLLINVPLVFSIPGFVLPILSLKNFYHSMKDTKYKYDKSDDIHTFENVKKSSPKIKMTIELFLVISGIIPLFLLSIIPHQEPRFLIPLIVPLSLLFNYHSMPKSKLLTRIWVASHVLCVTFYGFSHQSGVYNSMQYIDGRIKSLHHDNIVIIFYKTYMPPRYLMSLEGDKNVKVFDVAGAEESVFLEYLNKVVIDYDPTLLFVVQPGNLGSKNTVIKLYELNYVSYDVQYIFPHLSTEDFPDFKEIQNIFKRKVSFLRKLAALKEQFSIQIKTYKK